MHSHTIDLAYHTCLKTIATLERKNHRYTGACDGAEQHIWFYSKFESMEKYINIYYTTTALLGLSYSVLSTL
jgi:hypothetical protein